MALREVFARFTTRFNGTALQRGNSQVQGVIGNLRAAGAAATAFGGVVAGLAIVAVIRGWISAVNEFVQSMADVGDELDKTSRTLGVGTTALQEWRHAANLSGVSASGFTTAVRTLARNMSTALETPTSAAAIEFQRLGINVRDAEGNLRDSLEVMEEMADPLSQLTGSGQGLATANILMGRAGAQMRPLFENGAAGIRAMREEVEMLGGGASPEMIQASADLIDAQARLDLAFLSIKSRIATQLLPIVQSLTDGVRDVTAWFARNQQAVAILKVALIAVAVVVGILAVALALVLGPVLLGLLVIMSPIILSIVTLILVIEDLYIWMEGGDSVIGSFTESLLSLAGINFQEIRVAWRAFMGEIREGYNSIAEVIGLPTIAGPTVRDFRNLGAKAETAESGGEEPVAAPQSAGVLRTLQAYTNVRQAELNAPVGRRGFAPAPRREGGGDRTVTQTTRFEISGNDPQAIADSVRRIMDGQNRDAVEALTQ